MSKCGKLHQKAINSPHNVRFKELCLLAECYGWEFARQNGTSHRLYINEALTPEEGRRMNFQDYKGQAKALHVRQLLAAIDSLPDGQNE
jgi:hypothetical protein